MDSCARPNQTGQLKSSSTLGKWSGCRCPAGIMATQFSTRYKMFDPPILLRRPLPPKFLPALNQPPPKTSRHPDFISKGRKQLKEAVSTENNCEPVVQINIMKESPSVSPVTLTTAANEGSVSVQRAPTPATSRVTNFDLTPRYYDPKVQRNMHQQYANLLPDQIQTENASSPIKHSGPDDFLPHRSYTRHFLPIHHPVENEPYYETSPEFILDIVSEPFYSPGPVMETLNTPFSSPKNYNMLMNLLKVRLQQNKQTKVNILSLTSSEIPETTSRVPQRQIMLEQKLKDTLLLEEGGADSLHSLRATREFQHGSGLKNPQDLRNAYDGRETLTPCELAVYECLLHGGISLYLKAYFIDRLPDLTSICQTLVYVNLSFNDLHQFPTEVFDIENLEVLKLRNNPIKSIPFDIHRLRKLRQFIMSFCLLSALPPGLFLLAYLEVLDVSFNAISSLPNDISNLSLLKFLNVEGNQLPALPCGALKLRLQQIRVSNNMMHPLLWNENSWIKPQRLMDLAALAFSRNNMWQRYSSVPKDAEHILSKCSSCDCCKKPLYGQGFRLIRPCKKIFGVRKLPFMFSACSPSCYESFMSQKDTLSESLYGNVLEAST
ncbi:leucine-rich repeat-containing protein 63 isoform X2 [Ambystoma mexicanum]|uniref:leucine-rich repeat-containing protein 63 isoform X2 n=1 Tax=Ambystoma mexicanum TaxID=8296 RepID=UPI0037E8393C